MGNSLVSIIIPCFNYGLFLPYTLNNVLAQTYLNWECILVNDGSTDDTDQVIQPYLSDTRFIYVYQQNGGLSNARNAGLRKAKGDYIQFLDADDLMEERKIEVQVKRLESSKEIDITYSDVFLFNSGDNHKTQSNKMHLMANPQQGKGVQVINELLKDNFFLVHCALLRRSVVEDIGYFNEAMRTCEDWDYWFRCAYFGKSFQYFSSSDEKVYVRGHGSNMSGNRKNMWIGKIKFYNNALLIYKKKSKSIDESELSDIRVKTLAFLSLLEMRYGLFFGNMWSGLINVFKYMYYSRTLTSPLYEGLYWIKERIMNRNK